MSTTALEARLRPRLDAWRQDIVLFVRQMFNAEPDPWQERVLRSFVAHDRLAMKACVGPGKSTVLSWLIWWFMTVWPKPKVAVTSITWRNLQDNVWAELAKWQRRNEYLQTAYYWTRQRIYRRDNPEQWWASARNWTKSADPETMGNTLSGLHAEYTLAIADETGGMPSAVVQSASQTQSTGKLNKLAQAGNPTHLAGPLYDACTKARHLWNVHEVNGDPDSPNRAPRVKEDWAREQIEVYGRDSAFVRSKILGKFPRQASDALFGLHHFEDAYGRTHAPGPKGKPGPELATGLRALGVDVGRLGTDPSVVLKRDGQFIREIVKWARKDTVETARRVARIALDENYTSIRVDDIGLGGGVTDNLVNDPRLAAASIEVVPVNVGVPSKVTDPRGNPRFANVRAQLAFELLENYFAPGQIGIAEGLQSSPLQEQSVDIRYGFARSGTVQLEEKDGFRARHEGRSPDEFDAMCLAFADNVQPRSALLEWMEQRRAMAQQEGAA